MLLPGLEQLPDIQGRHVIVRASLNVPVRSGVVDDATRLWDMVPTLEYLRVRGAKVVLVGHLGREGASLAPVADELAKREPLRFISAPIASDETRDAVRAMEDGDIIMLQNVRGDAREEKNDPAFVDILASMGEYMVIDAFADAHRVCASMVGVAERLPTVFGRAFIREYEKLLPARTPREPSLCIVGGAKFETKLPFIADFSKRYTHIFAGGALANDIFKAKGYEIGRSRVSTTELDLARLERPNIILPIDVITSNPSGSTRECAPQDVRIDEMIVDAGPHTMELLRVHIENAASILWNGPLGFYENGFDRTTKQCAHYIAENTHAMSIVGGGDTIAAIHERDLLSRFGFLSTAGGAMFVFLQTGTLPVIDTVINKLK
jgi:phosphoglycerate kinase